MRHGKRLHVLQALVNIAALGLAILLASARHAQKVPGDEAALTG
jgi:hypothetical protein